MCQLAGEEPVYGVVIEGQRFDAGNPYGFLLANATLGLQHPKHGESLRLALKSLM
jgi:UTP--glucose-1-phosphate uridylyltransferase